jgi:hypothetical protein
MNQPTHASAIFFVLFIALLAGCSQSGEDNDQDFEPTPEHTTSYIFQVWSLNYTPADYLEWTELAPENRSDQIEPLFGQADEAPYNPVASTVTNATEWERVRQGFRAEWEAHFGAPENGVEYPTHYQTRLYNVSFHMLV